MESLSENFLFVWESADFVMSWHAPCLQKHDPPIFLQAPFSHFLESENCPFLVRVLLFPKKTDCSVNSRNIKIKSN